MIYFDFYTWWVRVIPLKKYEAPQKYEAAQTSTGYRIQYL